MGVSFFFVLSGFILAYSYLGQLRLGGEKRRFWEARFSRIYPVYLLSLLIDWPFRGQMTVGSSLAVFDRYSDLESGQSILGSSMELSRVDPLCRSIVLFVFPITFTDLCKTPTPLSDCLHWTALLGGCAAAFFGSR
jgi:hypothetical protein